jgi:hypothetical protein
VDQAPTSNGIEREKERGLEVIVDLVQQTARIGEAGVLVERLWKRRKVALVDGTTVSMPDTPKNQKAFPQSRSQGVGSGFPVARLVVIISLSTGVLRDLAMGPYKCKETGEPALLHTRRGRTHRLLKTPKQLVSCRDCHKIPHKNSLAILSSPWIMRGVREPVSNGSRLR